MHRQQVDRQIRTQPIAYIREEKIQAIQGKVVASVSVAIHSGLDGHCPKEN
ncbi:hypothetical protein D3C84_1196010 [compost metagenome]